MQFSYKARELTGAIVEGVLEAPDRFAAAKELRARNQTPLSVTALGAKGASKGKLSISFFSSVKLHEKIVFTHNLSGMLSAGLSLYRALEVQKKQNKNPALEKILDGILSTINQGGTLSDALAKYPKTFSALFISMVRAGEESGNLSGILKEIGSNLEKSYNLSRKVKAALVYPAVIISVIIIIGILMLIFVVPTLTGIFKEMGGELPATTKFVIAVSDFAAGNPVLLIVILLAVIGGVIALLKWKKVKPLTDKIVLKLPGIGGVVKKVNTARTARTLSSLLLAGVEMTRSLSITKDVLQNMYYKEVLDKAGKAVQKGDPLSTVFKSETDLYPIMVGEMVAVGEETGALTQMLGDVAVFYEDEVDATTKNLSTIIEPVLMVFIGGAVGFFAVSMISPMYSLLNNL